MNAMATSPDFPKSPGRARTMGSALVAVRFSVGTPMGKEEGM
jgi:hypothetical protein